MSVVSFADVVHQSVTFDTDDSASALVLSLIDTSWFQRLRDISQTANTRLVYMFSEHSRFGHSVGVAYLAIQLLNKFRNELPEIEKYRDAVAAAALLHDIGHLAPGSHTAFKTWFPELPDSHEEIAIRIIENEGGLKKILNQHNPDLAELVSKILNEDPNIPPWTWEVISGGGWNVDRGNWCVVDSVLAGVSYGKYNIPALTDAMVVTDKGHLALHERRLDAMLHFALSRHALYRQVYQHRTLLAADVLNGMIVKRARFLDGQLSFVDDTMKCVLAAKSPSDLNLKDVFVMREAWWRYHVLRWAEDKDKILSDLCNRYLGRVLFKTVRILERDDIADLKTKASDALVELGYDPDFYLGFIETSDMNSSESEHSMQVMLEDGRIKNLRDVDPVFEALVEESGKQTRRWLVMPPEAKEKVGRKR